MPNNTQTASPKYGRVTATQQGYFLLQDGSRHRQIAVAPDRRNAGGVPCSLSDHMHIVLHHAFATPHRSASGLRFLPGLKPLDFHERIKMSQLFVLKPLFFSH